MKKSKHLQLLLLLLLLPPKAWAFTTPAVTPRRASSFEVSSISKSSSSTSSSELWKVEKIDHISDWTTKNQTTTSIQIHYHSKIKFHHHGSLDLMMQWPPRYRLMPWKRLMKLVFCRMISLMIKKKSVLQIVEWMQKHLYWQDHDLKSHLIHLHPRHVL